MTRVLTNGADDIISARTNPWDEPAVTNDPFINVTAEPYGATGDGTTDDSTAIQAAFTALAATGGVVHFPPGTYLVSASLVAVSSLTVEGCGQASIIKLATGSDTHLISIPDGTSGVTFRNLKLDGNGTNQTTLDGDGDTVNVVNIISSSDITLENVEVANACDTGIHVHANVASDYTFDLSVRDCYIHDCGFQCVRTRLTDRVFLTGNRFYNWGTVTADSPAVVTTMAGEARNWRIIGNHFRNVAGTQFAIESSGTGGLLDSVISGNLLDGNNLGGNGISCMLYRCTLTGNVQTNGAGTHRSGYECGGTDFIVADNVIENGSINLGSSLTNTRIKCRGNALTNTAANGKGISVGLSTHVSVMDNTVAVSGTGSVHGIMIGTVGTAQQVNKLIVRGNSVYDGTNNAEGIGLHGDTGSSDIVIQGNVASGCYQGVYIAATDYHDEVTITGNDLRGNTTAIDDNSTGGTYRINNNILGSDRLGMTLNATGNTVQYAAAAPVGGAYLQGDIVYNTAPSATGTIGWVCTTAGTPGTWTSFGVIGTTSTTGEINLLDDSVSSITLAPAAGAANVCEVTITAKDAAAAAIDNVHVLEVYLSDSSVGAGLTGTTASGTVTAKADSGAVLTALTAKKHLRVSTLATGVFVLEITDTAKTGFYVCAVNPLNGKVFVSSVLTGSYGA